MERYRIGIQLNNDKVFEIVIGNNNSITFEYLIEYLAYNYPSQNFCPCFLITGPKGQVIKRNQKVFEFISNKNLKKIIFGINSPKECHCYNNESFYYKLAKLEMIQKIQDLINKNQNLITEMKKLEQQKKVLEMSIDDPTIIDKLKKIGIEGEFLRPRDNLALIDEKKNQIIVNEKKFCVKNFINFYDVIIDIKSIKDICEGWEIKMSDEGKKNYEEYQKQKCIKIGVIGNSNKGKSFLLSKISKTILPSGYSIRTEGLSIKYPNLKENENKKIILLDSAGLETPVLRKNFSINDENNEDDEKFNIIKEDNIIEEENKNEKENKKEKDNKNKINEMGNKNEKDISNIKVEFKEKAREKLITELFLQNYIINNSDILLVVVGILTFSEQKLINKIKLLQKKNNKPLFIIHNLMTYTSIEQIEEYIQEFLLKSATFSVEEGLNVTTKTESKKGKYFYEKDTKQKIYHLIYANEGSKAGEFYNNSTLQFIENFYQSIISPKKFDIIETIKKDFIDISQDIFEKIEKNITMEDFEKDTKSIKLNNHNNISLKKCFVDELGFSNLTSNEFEPKYNCYKKDDKLIVKIECPGNFGTLNYSFKENEVYKIIKISGEKKKDKEPKNISDNLCTSREYGKFSIEIPIKCEDNYIIKNVNPKVTDKKGILFLEYQLEEIMKGEGYTPNEEEEI